MKYYLIKLFDGSLGVYQTNKKYPEYLDLHKMLHNSASWNKIEKQVNCIYIDCYINCNRILMESTILEDIKAQAALEML